MDKNLGNYIDILIKLNEEYHNKLKEEYDIFCKQNQEKFDKKVNKITKKCLEVCKKSAKSGNKCCKISFERFLVFIYFQGVKYDYNFSFVPQKEKHNITIAVAKKLTNEGLIVKIETFCKFENDILVISWIC